MTTLLHGDNPMTSGRRLDAPSTRTAVRSAGVLLAALTLTVVVLVTLASVVDTWA